MHEDHDTGVHGAEAASRLLADLEQAERDWVACGAGSVDDDPQVVAAAARGAAHRTDRTAVSEWSAASVELDRVRDAQTLQHAALRARRDALRRAAVDRFGLDGSLPLPEQLRRVVADRVG